MWTGGRGRNQRRRHAETKKDVLASKRDKGDDLIIKTEEKISNLEVGVDFVVAKVNGIFFCSCYAPPRRSTEQFTKMQDCQYVPESGVIPTGSLLPRQEV